MKKIKLFIANLIKKENFCKIFGHSFRYGCKEGWYKEYRQCNICECSQKLNNTTNKYETTKWKTNLLEEGLSNLSEDNLIDIKYKW